MRKGKTRKKKTLSTVQRMYLSYVAICLIPMVVLTAALSVFMCRSYRREAASEQFRMAQTVTQALDTEFYQSRSLGQMLSGARWVKRRGAAPGLYDDQFDLRAKLDLCEDLRGYRGSSGAISQIAVVFPQKGEGYSTAGFYRTGDYFHTFSLERGQQTLDPETVYSLLPDQGALINGSDLGMTGGSARKLLFVEALEYNNPMRCFLIVELDTFALRNQIEFLTSGQMLSVSLRNHEDSELMSLRFASDDAEETYQCRSTYFPVEVTATFPRIPLIDARGMILIGMLVLLVVVLAARIAAYLTERTYRPLKDLVERVSSRSQNLHGENEYALIEDSISRLYSERENVLQVVERYRATARGNLLRQLLQGYFDGEEALEKMGEFGIAFTNDMQYLVILVEERGESFGPVALEEPLSGLDDLYEIAELSKTRLAVIIGRADAERLPLVPQEIVRQIAGSYRARYESTPLLTYGSVEQGILGISKSYYVASEYLTALLSNNTGFAQPDKRFYYPTEWELQLLNRIRAGQQDMAQTILGEIRGENQRRGISRVNMYQLIQMLAQTYARMIQELDPQPERHEVLFEALDSAQTPEIMWDTLYQINAQFCRGRADQDQDEDTERLIVDYVKEHLTDPNLSLKVLGDRFSLSVSAVSKMFKRVCGINFYDFLLSGRMELACEMLKNNKLSLSAVARAVGYENEYSFKRAFSRFYGMSVSEYQRKNNKK